jgi:hypothetical protein
MLAMRAGRLGWRKIPEPMPEMTHRATIEETDQP